MCSLKLIAEYLRRIFLDIGYTKGVGVMAITTVIALNACGMKYLRHIYHRLILLSCFFYPSAGDYIFFLVKGALI